MNFTHLKAFYTVAKNKSFTLASRELNVSQSTISVHVQALEKQYDIPLLKRNKKAIELTGEGKIVFSYGERIFSLATEMETAIEDLSTVESGELKIGSTPALAHYMLPKIVLALKERNHDLKLKLYTGLSREVLGKVLEFEYHAGVIGRVLYPGNVIHKKIMNPELYLITTDQMKDQITLENLSDYPLIFREQGSATREYVINEFQERNITLTNYIECENAPAIKRMVQLGLGGAFFPWYAIEEDVTEGKYRNIEILDELSPNIDLVFLMERRKSKTLRRFISTLEDYSFT